MAPSVSELASTPVENVTNALKAAVLEKKVDVSRLSYFTAYAP